MQSLKNSAMKHRTIRKCLFEVKAGDAAVVFEGRNMRDCRDAKRGRVVSCARYGKAYRDRYLVRPYALQHRARQPSTT